MLSVLLIGDGLLKSVEGYELILFQDILSSTEDDSDRLLSSG